MNKKGFANIILIVLGVVVVGVLGYMVLSKKPASPVATDQQSTSSQGVQATTSPLSNNTASYNPPPPDKTAEWKMCVNTKYGYEVKYPPTWKVWRPGAPEARLASCDENLGLIALSPNLFEYPISLIVQINIDVLDQERGRGTVYEGIKSIDDYFAKNPGILQTSPKVKETTIDGEKLVWLEGKWLLSFHNGSIFNFRVYNVDDATLDNFIRTFKFHK